MQVLLQVPLIGKVGDVELVLLVVSVDEVLEDGSRLPEDEVVVVGVDDGGNAAIGTQLEVPVYLGVLDIDLEQQVN